MITIDFTQTTNATTLTFDPKPTTTEWPGVGTIEGLVVANDAWGNGSNYANVVKENTITINFDKQYDMFGILWMAADQGNSVQFWLGGKLTHTITTKMVDFPQPYRTVRNTTEPFQYVTFYTPFDKIKLVNTTHWSNFETDDWTVGNTPEPGVPLISLIAIMLLFKRNRTRK